MGLRFGILGPLRVELGGSEIDISTPKLRSLLIVLLLNAGRTVPTDRIIDDLWGDEAPPGALRSLHAYVSKLRRLLEGPGGPARVVVTRARGYALDIEPEQIDVISFERLASVARNAARIGDHRRALDEITAALALWRGQALVDVAYETFAQGEIARLEELRLGLVEDRHDSLVACGRYGEAVAGLEAFVRSEPLRERSHGLLVRALYHAGRAADALAVARDFRARLADELGLDPSPAFVHLVEAVILHQLPTAPADAADPGVAPPTPLSTAVHEAVVPELVGRDRERASLEEAVQSLLNGESGVVLVAGEAGIGKTALLEWLDGFAGQRGVPVHWGRCPESEGRPAFWPWIEILRSVADSLDDDALGRAVEGRAAAVVQLVDSVADRLELSPAALPNDPETARQLLFEAVASFLDRAARRGPLLVLLDDLHWADPATLELLEFLTVRSRTSPVLFAATHRVHPADRSAELDAALGLLARVRGVRALTPSTLTASQVGQVVAAVTSDVPDQAVVDVIHERSGGNPFFVGQLIRYLTECRDAAAETAVPTGVRHVLLRRLQMVPQGVRSSLDVAAVLGRDFDVRLVASVAGLDLAAVLDHFDVAAAHGFVTVHEGQAMPYRFSHALIMDAILGELAPGRAARLHAAAGQALESAGRGSAAQVAEHFWRASGLVDADRTLRFHQAAAEEAVTVLAYEQAERLLRRGLDLAARLPDGDRRTELAIRLRLIGLLTSVGGWTADGIEPVVGPALDLASEAGVGPDLVPVWWTLWTLYTTRGEFPVARDLAQRMLERATDSGDGAFIVAAHVAAGYTAYHGSGAAAQALGHFRLARVAEDGADPRHLAATPEHLSVALRVAEAITLAALEPTRALEVAQEAVDVAVALARPFSEVYARLFAGWVGAWVRDPAATLRFTSPALEQCAELGFAYASRLTVPTHAWAQAQLGADPLNEASRIADSVEALRAAGHRHAEAQWLLLLADVMLLAGDAERARSAIAEVRGVLRVTGEAIYGPALAAIEERLAASWDAPSGLPRISVPVEI